MLHKHHWTIAQMIEIIFLTICLWHPFQVVKSDAIQSQKANLPSLTILFDTTIVDKNLARTAASKIVEDLSQNNELVIHNYTLVPFRRELKYEPIITADVNSYKAEIQRLKIKSESYNAEPLFVIKKSLSESYPPNPFVIVIVDSQPSESPTVPEILSAVNASKTRVIILTSSFKISIIDRYPNSKFTEITKGSQGQIFTFETNAGLRQALQFIYQIMNLTPKPTETGVVPGGWSEWSKWTVCNPVVSSLYRSDRCLCSARACNNPYPQKGGAYCTGELARVVNCTIHGGWTEWSDWSSCSCGVKAVKTRYRSCTNPTPEYEGKACSGPETEVTSCIDNLPCSTSENSQHVASEFATKLPSLTILLDTTTVESDLARTAASKIVDDLSKNNDLVIQNYTLVPISRELKYQPIIRAEVNSFKAEIQLIKIKPTLFIAQPLFVIKKSLSESYPSNPFIIVIVDSQPDDSPSVPEILSAISASKTRIIILTSSMIISSINRPPHSKFTEITKASGGQIFTFETDEGVRQALQFIYQIMNLTQKVTETGKEKPINLTGLPKPAAT